MIYEIDAKKTPKKCPHNKDKRRCRICGGSSFCIHDKRKENCRECKGVGICEHDKRKSRCRQCNGNEICPHNKQKENCRACNGSQICPHNKRKSLCHRCGGGSICIHDKQKRQCHQCGGSAFCTHNKRKKRCSECNPFVYLADLQRSNLNGIIKQQINLEKTKRSIEYLGCSLKYFKEYIKSKMVEDMNFDNIHLDHIKPISKFHLSNIDALLDCCHYTNFQPLFAKENMEKGNTWNEIDEIFWNENIKGKEYIPLYIPKK